MLRKSAQKKDAPAALKKDVLRFRNVEKNFLNARKELNNFKRKNKDVLRTYRKLCKKRNTCRQVVFRRKCMLGMSDFEGLRVPIVAF